MDYEHAQPIPERIAKVNALFDDAHWICIDSARGSGTGTDWREVTRQQLAAWGLQYHELRTGVKMFANYYIDDRAIDAEEFFATPLD